MIGEHPEQEPNHSGGSPHPESGWPEGKRFAPSPYWCPTDPKPDEEWPCSLNHPNRRKLERMASSPDGGEHEYRNQVKNKRHNDRIALTFRRRVGLLIWFVDVAHHAHSLVK